MIQRIGEHLKVPAFVLVTLAAIALAVSVGYALPQEPVLVSMGVVFVLVVVVALAQPILLPLLAMPLLVVVARFGAGPVDMTISDWVLGLAFWPAVLFAPRPLSADMRRLLWLNAIYQAASLFTVVANPYLANAVEWFHAWLLVAGALMLGWAVGASGKARLGVSLFLTACLALAVPTVIQAALQYAQGNFSEIYPKWPWPMHKNFIGNLISMAAVIVYARPRWLGWSRGSAYSSMAVFVTAIAASQSRQALVGLAIGLLVVSLRNHEERRRAAIATGALFPIGYVILTMVREQIASGNEHNSWFQRLEWYGDSVTIWSQSPFFGHGLRYWTQAGAPGTFQPPHAFLEVGASAGIVGLLGFLVWWVGTILVLYRVDPTYGTLALALVLARMGQTQLDLFWVSVSVSVPFAIVGVCLGLASTAAREGTPSLEPRSVASRGLALKNAGQGFAVLHNKSLSRAVANGLDDTPRKPYGDEPVYWGRR